MGGQAGGRVCWAMGGTLCGDKVQGSFVGKIKNGMAGNFYHLVRIKEGDSYVSIDSIRGGLPGFGGHGRKSIDK